MNNLDTIHLLAQYDTSGGGEVGAALGAGLMLVIVGIGLAVGIFLIAALWKIFTKAGKPGWAAIVPFYNMFVLLEIVGRPAWWFVLMCIPGVNFVVFIIVYIDLAKSFGKGVGFGIGMVLLSIIFIPMLGFGSDQYQGPAAAENG